MAKNKKRENPAKIQPSMAGTDTKIQLSDDFYNGVSKDVASSVTDIDDVLSMLKLAPATPTIKVNNRYEPPIYGLPQSIQDIITEICTKKQVSTEFVLSPLLAVAGAAAGRKAVLNGRGYENPPCFWYVVIADPGSNKSYPQKLISNPLLEINKVLAKSYDEELQEWKAKCAALSKGSKESNVPQPPKPQKHHVCVSDTTREALAEILVGSPDGLCQIRDELSGWLGDIGRYGKSGEISTYLSYWTGEGFTIDRKSEESTAIVDAVLYNLCGTIQPGILADSFSQQHISNGFTHRFMFFWPQIVAKKVIERIPTVPDMTAWNRLINSLYSLRQQKITLTLSDEANNVAMDYEKEIEDSKNVADIVPYEKGVLSKLDIIMLRLACVARMLAIADGDNSHEVTATEMKWACDLCRYLQQTQMRVYEELQSGNKQRPMNDRELIRAFFKRFESKGVTQGKLAKLLNTSQPYISQCVNPKAKPTQETESLEQ